MLNKENTCLTYRPAIVLIAITIVITLFTAPVFGHPHVFIAQRVDVVFDDRGLAGFRMHWQFDDMFSTMIAADHDKDQNGQLEKPEVASIKEKAFSYISESSYFTFITIDGRAFDVKYVTDFDAVLKDKKLEYIFFIPCHVTAMETYKKIKLATYDPTYYSAIFFAESRPVSLNATQKLEIKTAVKEDPDTLIYYDMIHPWTLFLEFREKP